MISCTARACRKKKPTTRIRVYLYRMDRYKRLHACYTLYDNDVLLWIWTNNISQFESHSVANKHTPFPLQWNRTKWRETDKTAVDKKKTTSTKQSFIYESCIWARIRCVTLCVCVGLCQPCNGHISHQRQPALDIHIIFNGTRYQCVCASAR